MERVRGVEGAYNHVDTAAQGYDSIDAAYKPSLLLTLAGAPMSFGGIYNLREQALFFADNVGMQPLVLAPFSETELNFTLAMIPRSPPTEG